MEITHESNVQIESIKLSVTENGLDRIRQMPFTRQHFLRHKPWLYHFTHPSNVDVLRQEMAMLERGRMGRAGEHLPTRSGS